MAKETDMSLHGYDAYLKRDILCGQHPSPRYLSIIPIDYVPLCYVLPRHSAPICLTVLRAVKVLGAVRTILLSDFHFAADHVPRPDRAGFLE